MNNLFPVNTNDIVLAMNSIDPLAYAVDRNYLNGHVTRLSPYISRGVLSTKRVLQSLQERGFSWDECEKLVQELCWRDYFQRVWQKLGDGINRDIRNSQLKVTSHQVPAAITGARTGIEAIDSGISELYETGYMHNHMRMYVASIACNVAGCHWLMPARWMYYHLLDADWASNACSWQWVSGTFSNKKYYANQENINRYTHSNQRNTFLDIDYDALERSDISENLQLPDTPQLNVLLPASQTVSDMEDQEVLIYNWYNLDPFWYQLEKKGRVLLIEPSVFRQYPVSQKCIDFMISLSKNISGIRVFTGEFSDLKQALPKATFIFREHPLNRYVGREEPREFISGYQFEGLPGFFGYWKKIEKEIRHAWGAKG
jgi:deoxyribodipyrimidine photo-lyase